MATTHDVDGGMVRNSVPRSGTDPLGSRPSDELHRLRRLVAMCSHLSAAAAQQTGLDTVARLLAETTGASVAVLDRGLDVLAAAGPVDPDGLLAAARERAGAAGLTSVFAAAARHRRALLVPGRERTTVVVAPVSVGDDTAGYLVAAGGGPSGTGIGDDMMLLASEHAAMVSGVLLAREVVVGAAAGRARRDLVEGLLAARGQDSGEATRWARHLGYDETRPHAVLALALAEGSRDADHAAAEGMVARLAPDAIPATRGDEVVAVVPAPDQHGAEGDPVERARELAARCLAELEQRGIRVAAAGIGGECRAATGISRSYSEAHQALDAGRRAGAGGRITDFADLGIHRLLLRFPEPGELRSFAEEVLGRLLAEEAATGMRYVETLATYFAENGSPSRAAQRLHVHPNTVAYRLRRAEEITGLSLDVQRDRLLAEVAVAIVEGPRRRA